MGLEIRRDSQDRSNDNLSKINLKIYCVNTAVTAGYYDSNYLIQNLPKKKKNKKLPIKFVPLYVLHAVNISDHTESFAQIESSSPVSGRNWFREGTFLERVRFLGTKIEFTLPLKIEERLEQDGFLFSRNASENVSSSYTQNTYLCRNILCIQDLSILLHNLC